MFLTNFSIFFVNIKILINITWLKIIVRCLVLSIVEKPQKLSKSLNIKFD